MEPFKDFLRLDVILRQCLGGVAFYFVLYLNEHHRLHFAEAMSWIQKLTTLNMIEILIVVFLTGTFLHAIQRSSLGLVVEHIRERILKFERVRALLFPTEALKMTLKRFERLPGDRICSELYSWGATTHSLYTVAVAIVAANLWMPPRDFFSCWDYLTFCGYLFFALVLFLLGLISDCRKFLVEDKLGVYAGRSDLLKNS